MHTDACAGCVRTAPSTHQSLPYTSILSSLFFASTFGQSVFNDFFEL